MKEESTKLKSKGQGIYAEIKEELTPHLVDAKEEIEKIYIILGFMRKKFEESNEFTQIVFKGRETLRARLEKLSVKPDDIVIAKTKEHHSPPAVKALLLDLKKFLRDNGKKNEVVIASDDFNVTTLKPDDLLALLEKPDPEDEAKA